MNPFIVRMRRRSMIGTAVLFAESSDDFWKRDGQDGWEILDVTPYRSAVAWKERVADHRIDERGR